MRDAVTLEARGISTAILVNDVFEPIAHATSALLDLPSDYVAKNVVWLPHPTSNLTAAAAATLIDDRIDSIRKALLGRADATHGTNGNGNGILHAAASKAPVAKAADARDVSTSSNEANVALETARGVVEGLAASLRADGADLVLSNFEAGLLEGEVRIGELTCDDGSCIMPTDALERMVEAMVRPKLASLERVSLREVHLEA